MLTEAPHPTSPVHTLPWLTHEGIVQHLEDGCNIILGGNPDNKITLIEHASLCNWQAQGVILSVCGGIISIMLSEIPFCYLIQYFLKKILVQGKVLLWKLAGWVVTVVYTPDCQNHLTKTIMTLEINTCWQFLKVKPHFPSLTPVFPPSSAQLTSCKISERDFSLNETCVSGHKTQN